MLLRDYPEFHLNLSFLPGEFRLPMSDRILCKAIFCFDVMNQTERERWIIVLLGKVSDLFLPIIKLLTVGTKQQFQQLQAKCISVGIVLRLDLWPPSCQLCVTADSVESFAQIWALASTDSVFSASAPLLNGWISVCRDTCNSPTEASVPKRAQLWPECVCCLASLTWSVVT